MRLFIALPLPALIKHALSDLQDRLRDDVLPLDWQTRPRMHLTLHFLGELDDDAPERLVACMDAATAGRDAFDLQLNGLGAFPSAASPHILWAGVMESPGLLDLQAALKSRLDAAGFPTESRPYCPHITLARVHGEPAPSVRQALRALLRHPSSASGVSWRADRITLYHSHQDSHGLHYSPIAESRLQTTD